MIAHVQAVDLEALAMLPGVSHLQVAQPRARPVQGALLLLAVQRVNLIPTGVVVGFSLDALVGQVVEVGAEIGLDHVVVHINDLAVHQAHEVLAANIKHVVT